MLALIAGTGDLPPALIARITPRPLICALAGFTPQVTPDLTFRIEQLGTFLADLRARGITQICMAGAVRRPAIDPLAIDSATMPLIPALQAAMAQGDDGALRAVIAIMQDAGLSVVAAHTLAPDLLPATGVLAGDLTAQIRQDAVLGEQVIAAMGRADIGQACLIRAGRVLAREDAQGTDAMIARLTPDDDLIFGAMGDVLGAAAEWLSGADGTPVDARGAILFKAPKPDQDRRADLPVIGPDTLRAAVAAQLRAIVVEAGGVMILDQPAMITACADAGITLWVRPKGGV
jgi:UDP-2,3-diacylglucosamine hydrolase